MHQLYKSELRFIKKQKKKLHEQRNASLYSITPIKDILRAYNELTVRGFNSQVVSETLTNLNSALRARGYQARVQNDYTISELDQSWRMQKLVDDVIFGLKEDQFFSPQDLAQTALKLGELGYKNTQLIPQFFEKLQHQLNERFYGAAPSKELKFEDAVYGGPKNFIPRHYIFQGFQDSKEFNEYLSILLDWEGQQQTNLISEHRSELSQESMELERALADTIHAAVQVKELQKDFSASIENLRTQYFQMQQAADKYQFIQENEYIKYDLLELQELLVKGGYVEPNEFTLHQANEPFDKRMQRAASVFYDYVLNYSPELLSPQYNSFYEAAIAPKDQNKQPIDKYLKENQNTISLQTLSQTIVGVANQALSFRRDVNRNDYLNKFYEQYLMPLEHMKPKDQKEIEKIKYDIVLMERSYLKSWQQFKEQVVRLLPLFRDLTIQDRDSVEGQLHALNALSVSRLDEPKLREQIIQASLSNLKTAQNQSSLSQLSIVSGLQGIALSPSTLNDTAKQLVKHLVPLLDANSLSFTEQIDALWSLCALQEYDNKAISDIINNLNKLNFERINHDLKYEEYTKLKDINNALRIEGPETLRISNKGLLMGLNSNDLLQGLQFKENLAQYDPFKKRVIQALSKGLTDASISHQVIMEQELQDNKILDTEYLDSDKYPYKPEILMGYKAEKVALFVLPEINVSLDTKQPNGDVRFRMRLLEKSNPSLKCAAIAITDVVKYDIERLQVNINKNFNFTHQLDKQIQFNNHSTIDLSELSELGLKFIQQGGIQFATSLSSDTDAKKMDAFVKKLYQIFHIKQQNDLRFEEVQRNTGYDELRFQIMKLSLLYDSLSKDSQNFLRKLLPPQYSSFQQMLQKVSSTIQNTNTKSKDSPKEINLSWIGTRLEVELPHQVQGITLPKSIVPEIINQRFMWVDDYFHYDDWRDKQKATFDNFNLLVIPHNQDAPKYFFDKDNYNRRIPQGIFPHPNHKRQIMQPSVNVYEQQLQRFKGNDEFVQFEQEPYKMMVLKELKKSESLQPLNSDISFITNLQNLKQGLKSDFSDKEILNTILLNLNFTDQLIEQHLNTTSSSTDVKYVTRDSSKFRQFVKSTYESKDREDPYTHFFSKEAAKKEQIYKLLEQEEQRKQMIEENSPVQDVLEEGNERREKLQDKIDKILLDIELQNEDLTNISSSLRTNVNLNYDLSTLVKSEFVYDIEPELIDNDITDEQYLQIFRRRAESKLIKMKIIYKANQGKELTQLEKQYLKKWVSDIQKGENRHLNNLRDSMVPKTHSSLKISDIEAKSLYALNSVSKVSIDRDTHGSYAVNDLVVELSHFLDEEVINKVETELYSERMRKEWNLSKDFKAIETRNKEIGLVLNELEELAWRSAGMFNEQDVEYIKRMLSVKRNKDSFDKEYYHLDMNSLENHINEVNTYDQRISLLEKWIVRKEDEFKSRVVKPPQHLQKSDQELHQKYEAPIKRARENLVAKLLIQDEYGNTIDKQYKDLTSRELHQICENVAVRLYLFNYEYPEFIRHAVKGIMEHPNLLKSDKDMIENYCKMFELDWKGEKELKYKEQFLFMNPVYVDGLNIKNYGEITNDVVKEKLQRACTPFVEETTKKIINYYNNS